MPHDIFISYSRRDLAAVKPIKEELERLGFSCWMDLEGIESGSEEFTRHIVEAIDGSRVVLFFLSRSSQSSEWSLKELRFGRDKKKRVVIVRFNNDAMSDLFSFNFSGVDIVDWRQEEQKRKLFRDLERWAERKPPSQVDLRFNGKQPSPSSETPTFREKSGANPDETRAVRILESKDGLDRRVVELHAAIRPGDDREATRLLQDARASLSNVPSLVASRRYESAESALAGVERLVNEPRIRFLLHLAKVDTPVIHLFSGDAPRFVSLAKESASVGLYDAAIGFLEKATEERRKKMGKIVFRIAFGLSLLILVPVCLCAVNMQPEERYQAWWIGIPLGLFPIAGLLLSIRKGLRSVFLRRLLCGEVFLIILNALVGIACGLFRVPEDMMITGFCIAEPLFFVVLVPTVFGRKASSSSMNKTN